MKILVPTFLRVGSTWVSEMLCGLVGQERRYDFIACDTRWPNTPLSEKELDLFRNAEGPIIKTHRFAPFHLLSLLTEEFKIVVVRRNLYDTLVSLILYEKNTRMREGLEVSHGTQRLLTTYPTITDKAFINLLIDQETAWLTQTIRYWLLFDRPIAADGVLVFNYDKMANNPLAAVQKLNTLTRSTSSVIETVVKETSFEKMKRRHNEGFVRKGKVGGYRKWLDEGTRRKIKQIEQWAREMKYEEL